MTCGDCGRTIEPHEAWTTSRYTEQPQHWKCPAQ